MRREDWNLKHNIISNLKLILFLFLLNSVAGLCYTFWALVVSKFWFRRRVLCWQGSSEPTLSHSPHFRRAESQNNIMFVYFRQPKFQLPQVLAVSVVILFSLVFIKWSKSILSWVFFFNTRNSIIRSKSNRYVSHLHTHHYAEAVTSSCGIARNTIAGPHQLN